MRETTLVPTLIRQFDPPIPLDGDSDWQAQHVRGFLDGYLNWPYHEGTWPDPNPICVPTDRPYRIGYIAGQNVRRA